MKVYGELGPKKILKFQSVWLYKYSPIYDTKYQTVYKGLLALEIVAQMDRYVVV